MWVSMLIWGSVQVAPSQADEAPRCQLSFLIPCLVDSFKGLEFRVQGLFLFPEECVLHLQHIPKETGINLLHFQPCSITLRKYQR